MARRQSARTVRAVAFPLNAELDAAGAALGETLVPERCLTGGWANPGRVWAVRGTGCSYVLKSVPGEDWSWRAGEYGRLAPVLAGRGHPVAVPLAVGEIDGAGWFCLPLYGGETLAEAVGAGRVEVDEELSSHLIGITRLQEGLEGAGEPLAGWSEWVEHVLTPGSATWAAGLRLPRSARLALAALARGPALGDGDLVHGDFHLGNMLWEGGRVAAMVDAEALGRGCRCFDLVRLWWALLEACETWVGLGRRHEDIGVVRARRAVAAEALSICGPQRFGRMVAYESLVRLEWHAGTCDLAEVARVCRVAVADAIERRW